MQVELHFRDLELGKDYWVEDDVLPNPLEVAQRCIANSTWTPVSYTHLRAHET